MSDRELLEMAAKAAGLRGSYMSIWGEVGISEDDPDGGIWNPLEDDGDALRLAVKLRLELDCEHDPICAGSTRHDFFCGVRETRGIDAHAATRRAIVRAAAEIGKAMP